MSYQGFEGVQHNLQAEVFLNSHKYSVNTGSYDASEGLVKICRIKLSCIKNPGDVFLLYK